MGPILTGDNIASYKDERGRLGQPPPVFILGAYLSKKPAFQQVQGGNCVSAEGLEPSTNGLKGHCSAIELRAHCVEHSIMLANDRQQRVLD